MQSLPIINNVTDAMSKHTVTKKYKTKNKQWFSSDIQDAIKIETISITLFVWQNLVMNGSNISSFAIKYRGKSGKHYKQIIINLNSNQSGHGDYL